MAAGARRPENLCRMNIRPATVEDAPAVAAIYAPVVRDTCTSFETEVPDAEQMRSRIEKTLATLPWLVAVADDGLVCGYAYASRWKERAAYRHTAESTIYLKDGHGGRGIGKALYARLLDALARQDCHVILGCIALPNESSVALHESLGFTKVAHFSEVGRKFHRWLDVGYWQLQR